MRFHAVRTIRKANEKMGDGEQLTILDVLNLFSGGKFRGGGLQTVREPTYWNAGTRIRHLAQPVLGSGAGPGADPL